MIQSPEKTTVQQNLKTATLDVKGMKCAGCVSAVEKQLTQNTGVTSACVNLVTEVAVVEYIPEVVQPENLAEKLTLLGFPSQPRISQTIEQLSQKSTQKREIEQKEQIWGLVVALMLLFFSTLGHLEHSGGPSIPVLNYIGFHWALATLALFIPGRPILVDGWRGLWHKMPNMNTLVALGTGSAYLTSCIALVFPQLGWECFFDEPVMLLGFILLGRTLESKARSRASVALEALVALQPPIAYLIGNPHSLEQAGIVIPVEQVRVGECLKVLPGEKIPVDGKVINGQTTVDESLLTGESMPVVKQFGENVTAGSLNLSGAIAIQATRIGSDTTLAKIIASVEEAQTRKAPVQKLVDTVAGYFAYSVITFATLTFLFWYFIGVKLFPWVLTSMEMSHEMGMMMTPSPMILSLKLAIAVLVIACPCALGLATPTALLVGTGIGAERGILIKGGDILEKVYRLQTIVFDKTGTLTVGHPQVTDCISLTELTNDALLQLAATVESGTTHPLATAILDAIQEKELPLLSGNDYQTESGFGVSANIAGKRVLLGNEAWLTTQGLILPENISNTVEPLLMAGKTVVYLASNDQLLGMIALQDQLRPDALSTVRQLKELGLEVILVTGDHDVIAQAIAKQLEITQVYANIRPQQKAELIKSFQNNSLVAMVGDGINDAPALAQADIGIALKGGTEVALETAGIVLMSDRLLDVVESIRLSLGTFNKIRQNLFWALGYNILVIPIAAGLLLPRFGFALSPAVAGAFMAFSSVTVVTNSLLLRRQFSNFKIE
ncbi:heavy metal translocating P-type ATPase [Aphanothece hegewaldii CCALA 016]|uniref:Heavy metal translocating P-type ATPase n=1 Tax=Aphanothece hegewaldii CCALA 016 TaxID=2107694 RepID=A0A2T1LTS3_9CHRO|nr:heavy metal translocating P-type ATPase [Aphanothece hegewaldii]PSF34227.1 heavy metal translocating P-type ATPase [Aphanothece hegewaldii CCALA 016]